MGYGIPVERTCHAPDGPLGDEATVLHDEDLDRETAVSFLKELEARLDAVKALHSWEPTLAVMLGTEPKLCDACSQCSMDESNGVKWPCPTYRAASGSDA